MTLDLDIPWQTARFAAFDLETTGRDAAQDRIIEIGLVVFEGGEVVDRWQQLVDPGVKLPDVIVELTGITDADLKGQPPFSEVVDELMSRIEGQPLLAYNHEFDTGMLAGELQRLGRGVDLPPCLDPFPLCWEYLREPGHTPNAKLGTIAEFLGVPLDTAHRADQDAEAAGRVLLALPGYAALPDSLDGLLQIQRALMQKLNERFARFRRGREGESKRSVLGNGELVIDLDAAYVYGSEPDPVRALFKMIPDVRDM